MEVVTDCVEIFGAKGEGEGGGVAAFENPLEIGIFGGIQLGEGVFSSLENSGGDVAFDVIEKGRIAAEAAHHPAGEEQLEESAPARGVPAMAIKVAALGEWAAGQQAVDHFLRMNEG